MTDFQTDTHNQRRRILISAYAFSPVRSSEPAIGWNICTRLAAYHDVTVLTRSWDEDLWAEDREDKRKADEFMERAGQIPGLTIHFVRSTWLSRMLQPKPHVSLQTPLYFAGYAAWQRAAYREAVRLHAEQPFDLMHQLTITTFREPGYLWKLNVPFLWGPIGGGDNIPWNYLGLYGWHDRIYYGLKNIANSLHTWTKPRARSAARRADCVLVTSEHCRRLSERWGGKPYFLLDTGTPKWNGRVRQFDATRPLKLQWGGLHLGRKAVPIALRALAELKKRGLGAMVRLTITGAGPESAGWRRLANDLAISDMVEWTGQISFQDVREKMEQADMYIMPSVQEGTSTVVMEALALGLPFLCHDISGLAVAVDETCGIKVPLRNATSSIQGFADAISKVVSTPGLLERLSAGALRRAEKLSLNTQAREISELYEKVLNLSDRAPKLTSTTRSFQEA